jgi:monoamine oxidase
MHKRDFLKAIAFACFEQIRTVTSRADFQRETRGGKRSVVIGAGLSGLAAASELQAHGHEVVVVEARNRTGGRIWTSREWADIPLDLGASWIHGVQGNPLTELADAIQAPRLVTEYDKAITYSPRGRPLQESEEQHLERLRTRMLQAIERAQRRDEDTSLRQAVESIILAFPAASEARRYAEFILNSMFEQEYAGSASQLSAHWFDSAEEFDGDDALFPSGFGAIAESLAKGLTIRFGQVVREVQWDSDPARVITQDSEYEADHVVVTLPLGILQAGRVTFKPGLPRKKAEAIAELGMGLLNKCYLRFEEPFWPVDVDWLEYIPETPGAWTEWVSFWRVAKQPVLLGFNAAARAREMEELSDQATVESGMQTLRAIYGRRIPQPIGYQVTRWAKDPFALGSYSFNAVGSTPGMRQALASSAGGRLFFAGEASDAEYFGTAHGAYLSGLRAAGEILAT